MPTVEKISIALPPEMVQLIRGAVKAGEYASSSEVVRDALRDWTRRRAQKEHGLEDLRRVWQEVLDDGRPGVPAREVLDRLRRKYSKLVEDAREVEV